MDCEICNNQSEEDSPVILCVDRYLCLNCMNELAAFQSEMQTQKQNLI